MRVGIYLGEQPYSSSRARKNAFYKPKWLAWRMHPLIIADYIKQSV